MLLTASPSNQLTQYGSVPKSSNFEKIRLRRTYQLLFQKKVKPKVNNTNIFIVNAVVVV